MSEVPFYSKYDFVNLMRKKRGIDYTFGWLAMAYALPPMAEEDELAMIQKEVKILLELPDYAVDTALLVV